MAVASPGDMIERRMAMRSDAITFVGKTFITVDIPSGGAIASLGIRPHNFSDRLSMVNSLFARYRFKKIVLELTPTVPSVVVGIQDDVGGEGGEVASPTTPDDIVALRSSTILFSQQQLKTLTWSPVDKNQWWFTEQGSPSAPADPRLSTSCTLYAAAAVGTGSSSMVGIVYYTVEFAGAVDVPGGV